MRRSTVLGMAVVLLLACGLAVAGDWSSKVPAGRRVGPKYGDFLKKERVPARPKSQGSKKIEKKDPGSPKEP